MPSDLYVRWKDGEDIDDELMPYYNWASNLMTRPSRQDESRDSSTGDFIVRSSAVYAEDGEELSGAGIYDSVVVEQHRGHLATFEDFKAAVLGDKAIQSIAKMPFVIANSMNFARGNGACSPEACQSQVYESRYIRRLYKYGYAGCTWTTRN